MPIFEFKCTQCHTDFEEYTSYSAIKKIVCPKCQSKKIEKKVSAPGAIQIGKSAPSSCSVAQGCPAASMCGPKGGCGFDV